MSADNIISNKEGKPIPWYARFLAYCREFGVNYKFVVRKIHGRTCLYCAELRLVVVSSDGLCTTQEAELEHLLWNKYRVSVIRASSKSLRTSARSILRTAKQHYKLASKEETTPLPPY